METVLLKVPDVMKRLAVGQTKVYELMSTGALRSVKVGRSRRVPSDELDRFLSELDNSCPNLRLPVSMSLPTALGECSLIAATPPRARLAPCDSSP